MSELTSRRIVNSRARVALDHPQPRRRLLLALILLVVALFGVVLRDQEFWFGSDESTLDSDGPSSTIPSRTPANAVPSAKQAHSLAARTGTTPTTRKIRALAANPSNEPKAAEAPAVAINRTVLPPLDVEVIAGDAHSTVHPGSNSTKVEITHPEAAAAAPRQSTALAAATNAAERQQMSIDAVRPQASYPLLAQHMNVQGSVVLQAVIGADGVIQGLHVLSGPAILVSAAQQAVRQWRFKPMLQNGQAVESKAKITVNFTIKVADVSSKDQPGL